MPIVLASTSRIRREILANAGLKFVVVAAPVDEAALKASRPGLAAPDLGQFLARAKAIEASKVEPGKLVIGADQVLHCGGKAYDKPRSQDEARAQLLELKGKPHTLTSAISCARDGSETWSYRDSATLTMRDFSERFLNDYLETMAGDVLTTVGGYKLEGLGIQLFDSIAGDYFTILGLPILPLLKYLRDSGEIAR